MGFETLGLAKPLLRALERQGLIEPTPIQLKSIPIILEGSDLVGLAQTGTGKTAAYTLPILNRLHGTERRGKFRPVRMLVLSPTRELAIQIEQVIKEFASAVNLKSVPIFGGSPFFKQSQALRKGADIVVCTPGRLEDHISKKTLDLSRVTHFVLDEADQMLDIGFLPAIKRIFAFLPKSKQTLLFSATMSKEIKKLSVNYLQEPTRVSVSSSTKPAEQINQSVLFLSESDKLKALKDLISLRLEKRILVFSRTKHGADRVVKSLTKIGFTLSAIHGNKSQSQRQKALDNFRQGKCFVLVATDIAARGLDIQNIELVVNYDLPDTPETYIHRIGRTARAGASGNAISFCAAHEKKNLKAIENLIKIKIASISLDRKDVGNARAIVGLNLIKTRQKTEHPTKLKDRIVVTRNISGKKKNTRWSRSQKKKSSLDLDRSGERSLFKR